MAQVLAVLQAASTSTVANTISAPVTPSPTPTSMIGTPTIATWVVATDLDNAQMQYGYLIYQTYNAAGGVTGMAQATGTSSWVSIPDVSHDFPAVAISATAASALSSGVVTFTISGTVSYTQTTPGLYSVTTA